MDLESIRENIKPKYDDEFLKQILIQFHEQKLDSSNFYIENKRVNKILDYFFWDLIYAAKSKNGRYSVNEVLYDDVLLAEAIDYIHTHPSFYYYSNDITNLKNFFFCSSMVGKVTNFNPVIARKIYECYAPYKNATIFDYSCGFGSRMLGALSSQNDYKYIGIEPYTKLFDRLLVFADWIKDNLENESDVRLYNMCSEEFIPSLCDMVDLSFSSPPYFNYEIYTKEESQSCIKYPTYKEWVEFYMRPTIINIYKYTKENGIHIVNLQDVRKLKLVTDWLNIARDVGFVLEEERTIDTFKRSTGRSKSENKLLVMRK